MRSRQKVISGALLLSALLCVALAAIALAVDTRVSIGGDPYHVTAQRLRDELAKTGIKVDYEHPAGEKVPTVSGVARFGSSRPVGFEYQLFPSSNRATVRALGSLKASDFGWRT